MESPSASAVRWGHSTPVVNSASSGEATGPRPGRDLALVDLGWRNPSSEAVRQAYGPARPDRSVRAGRLGGATGAGTGPSGGLECQKQAAGGHVEPAERMDVVVGQNPVCHGETEAEHPSDLERERGPPSDRSHQCGRSRHQQQHVAGRSAEPPDGRTIPRPPGDERPGPTGTRAAAEGRCDHVGDRSVTAPAPRVARADRSAVAPGRPRRQRHGWRSQSPRTTDAASAR